MCPLSVFCVHCLYSVSMSGNYYMLLSEYIVYYLMSLSAAGDHYLGLYLSVSGLTF